MRLIATSGGQTLSFPLRQGSTLIGRHSACHICIPSKTLSRRHCQCYVDGTNVTLRDLGSSHGTFVNGKRVERADLHDGDVITLGGFELRFDSEGAAPAYGRGAGAAEDIVVPATPTGMAMPAGPPPGAMPTGQGPTQPLDAELAPPAPTDTPESPSGDETPADQSFMPVAYTPQRETVLGAGGANQPQLVVRDGRWFLRDPRTGREVEIAPTGAGAAAAVARPAEGRRPNTRLLVTVIAIAAILVITFAVAILRPPPKPDGPPQLSDAGWAQIVDPGVDELKKGNFAQAIAQFKAAYTKRPNLEAARLLMQYALLRQTAGDDFTKLDKTEGRRYLESVENTRCPSEKALAFVREQRDWIDKESFFLSVLEEAKSKLATAGEGNEDALREIIASLQQIPPERYAVGPAKTLIADITKTMATNRIRRADREKAQLQWAKAVIELQAALPNIADPALKAKTTKDIEDCRRYALEDGYVRQAQTAIGSQNLDEAERLLKLIKPGYYYERAQQMLASITNMRAATDLKRRREEVSALYNSGAPPEAIEEAIKRNKLEGQGEFTQMVERARRVQTILAAGKKAEDAEEWAEAEGKYEEAVGIEPDEKNDYHRQAQRLLDAFKARYPEIAARLAGKGYAAINKDPIQARKFFEQALKYEADNKRATKGLEHLELQAKHYRNQGFIHASAKRWQHAKEAYEKARDCAPPGSPLYQGIVQDLQRVLQELGE